MTRLVVDTNVPVIANGRNTNVSIECRLAAIDLLHKLIHSGQTVLDLGGAIQEEYHVHLNPHGQPGVGDRFYQMILNSAPTRVERINLPIDPQTGEYVDFPSDPALNGFDRSDRKFAAAARRGQSPVANATDSDWLHFRPALNANGIEIMFVCGCDQAKWTVDP